jgi:hypothetical protein
MGRTCSTDGAKRNTYRILVGMTEENSPLERPRSKWMNNYKMRLREVG